MLFDNLAAIADRAPAGNGLRLAGGPVQTYRALLERIARLAGGLVARGIAPGDAVAILLPNGPDLFVATHALCALGAIAMPLSPAASPAEILLAARKARIAALLVRPDLYPLAEDLAGQLGPGRPPPVLIAGPDGPDSMGALERAAPATLPALPAATPALYLLSSGSTGLPKIVPHSHGELLADARRTSTAWQLTPDDTVFDMLPPNFAMGLLLGLTNAAEAGASTVYWNDPRPLTLMRGALLEALARERVTFMGAVPAMYETLTGARNAVDLGALRLAFSGGAGLRRDLFEKVRDRFGITLRQSYGSTEAIFVAHNDAPDADAAWSAVGRPAGDAKARILPDPALDGASGELLLRSSSMMRGYLDAPEATAAAFEDGWFRTGDLARLDAEGRLHITGRSKLLIEVSGYKVDPIEVEEALSRHPAVAEAVVVPVDDGAYGGARLKAVVVAKDQVAAAELDRHLRDRLSSHKIPALFEFRDSLPKSSAGKVLRTRLAP